MRLFSAYMGILSAYKYNGFATHPAEKGKGLSLTLITFPYICETFRNSQMKRILLVIVSLVFWASTALGQIDMSVSSRVELVPDDADAVSYYRQVDVNDQVCAIIKVTPSNVLANQLVLHTKGGMVPVKSDEIARKSGEWWFWVSPTVTNIMFTCQGYTPIDWIGVALSPGKVYRLDIEVESLPSLLAVEEKDCDWVDLGLPSKIKWAKCNLGASTPIEYGYYLSWGEKWAKTDYSWSTYKWACKDPYADYLYTGSFADNYLTKYCPKNKAKYWGDQGRPDGKTILDSQDDAAHVLLGDQWRIPTSEEWEELIHSCSLKWVIEKGVNGCRFTGPNGNSIFLPAAGTIMYTEKEFAGVQGQYLSSSLCSDFPNTALILIFGLDEICITQFTRANGYSVRPVTE